MQFLFYMHPGPSSSSTFSGKSDNPYVFFSVFYMRSCNSLWSLPILYNLVYAGAVRPHYVMWSIIRPRDERRPSTLAEAQAVGFCVLIMLRLCREFLKKRGFRGTSMGRRLENASFYHASAFTFFIQLCCIVFAWRCNDREFWKLRSSRFIRDSFDTEVAGEVRGAWLRQMQWLVSFSQGLLEYTVNCEAVFPLATWNGKWGERQCAFLTHVCWQCSWENALCLDVVFCSKLLFLW